MTISVAWVRTIGATSELLFASDSRYRSFGAWDCGPKLFQLHGTGGVIGIAGDTEVALAIVAQLQNCVSMYSPFGDGAIDITHTIGHFLRLINNMGNEIADKLGFTTYFSNIGSRAGFVIGGYSYQYQTFKLSHIRYRRASNAFVKRPPIARYQSHDRISFYQISHRSAKRKGGTRNQEYAPICIVGDYLDEFMARLDTLIGDKNTLDMEPFQVLTDMIRSGAFPEIGGAPQLIKAYVHLNTLPMGILWKKPEYVSSTPASATESVYVLGRPLMHYERTTWPVIDPDNLSAPTYPLQSVRPIFR